MSPNQIPPRPSGAQKDATPVSASWRCRDCGRKMLFMSEPNFCPHCRSSRMRPEPRPTTPTAIMSSLLFSPNQGDEMGDPKLTKGKGRAVEWIRHHANYDADFCLLFPFYRDPNGYGQFGYLGKMHYAHRFMCELVHGSPPPGHEAAHSCGNGHLGCANPKHLSWKTRSANRQDSTAHGMGVRNHTNNRRKLTEEQLQQIHALKGKKTQVQIGEMFGISAQSVRSIFTGNMYAGEPKVPYWTLEEEKQLRDGIAAGMNFTAVAKMVGRDKHAVASKAYRLGLKSGQPPHPDQRYAPRGHHSV